MKIIRHFPIFSGVVLFLLYHSCKKENITGNNSLPKVTTDTAYYVSQTDAIIFCTVTDTGGLQILERGGCWSTSPNPTIADDTVHQLGTAGPYYIPLSNLNLDTKYYVKGYAINKIGLAYGNELVFRTLPLAPTVTTSPVTDITGNSATSGGNITSDGGDVVTARGVCWLPWDWDMDPTIEYDKTMDGGGSGPFTSQLDLTINTHYRLRAYATNRGGTTYGDIIEFSTNFDNGAIIFNPNITYGTMPDIDGNVYKTVIIGAQTWMAENLKTTKYNDGKDIPIITNNDNFISLDNPGLCWYNNDDSYYKDTYGALYNWYTVNTRKLCPIGWHVPTAGEYSTLRDYLGGVSISGGKLKERGPTHWLGPNEGATNKSGFTALPGGMIDYITHEMSYRCLFWSATPSSEWTTDAVFFSLSYYEARFGSKTTSKKYGFSVRCVKD